jgi:polyhydroxybutyrate depolymerase
VHFISALIDHLEKKYNIDNERVYVTGISNGGMMTFRLGCELSADLHTVPFSLFT